MALPSRKLDLATPGDWRERFWKLIDVKSPKECWDWQGVKDTNGYGIFSVNGVGYKAHRIAFETKVRPIPNHDMVLHECDNRLCCNYYHMRLGTNSDNMRSAVARGKVLGQRRFDDETVEKIRAMYKTGDYTQEQIAEVYGTDQAHISRIVNRVYYK